MSDNTDYKNKVRSKLKREEGCLSHMYLDTRGYVTVGVGHMMPSVKSAKKLKFILRSSGKLATPDQISDDFTNVKNAEPGRIASSYKPLTKLDLPDSEVDIILDKQIDEFESALKNHFSNYYRFPHSAQHALLDMAFNLGAQGLLKKFPKLIANAEKENWDECANECRRVGIGDSRNESTKKLFSQAAQNNGDTSSA